MTRLSIRMLLAVLAVLAMASGSRALLAGTCGDYLQHKSPGETGELKPPMPGSSEIPLAPKRCNGPRCSQAPVSPASVPVPASSSAPSETRGLMIIVADRERPSTSGSFWRTAPQQNYLYFAAEEVFHPPRFA